jgi:phosphatidate phosphatase APP1
MGTRTPKPFPAVWQISALSLVNKRTLITGVLLTNVPYDVNRKSGNFRNLVNIIRTYFINPYANKDISLISNGITTNIRTDGNGSFWIIADYKQEGKLEITIPDKLKPLKIIQNYPIIHNTTHSTLGIISDIGDTIIESFSVSFFKRIAALLF